MKTFEVGKYGVVGKRNNKNKKKFQKCHNEIYNLYAN